MLRQKSKNRVNELIAFRRTFIKNIEFSSNLKSLAFLVLNNYMYLKYYHNTRNHKAWL